MEALLQRIPGSVAEIQAANGAAPSSLNEKQQQQLTVSPLSSGIRCCVSNDAMKSILPVTRTTSTTSHHHYHQAPLPIEKTKQQHYNMLLRHSTLQLLIFIFALLFVSNFIGCTTATPLPSISSPGPSSKQEVATETGVGTTNSKPIPISQQQQQQQQSSVAGLTGAGAGAGATPSQVDSKRSNTAEKLKRGLTNFMNQLNPAPFFVPATIQGEQGKAGDKQPAKPNTLSADNQPATIVNSDSSLVLKGSANRWSFARPIGGPLRWGRRR